MVTPDWLWCCAERWELADEKVFGLCKKSAQSGRFQRGQGHPSHPTNDPAEDPDDAVFEGTVQVQGNIKGFELDLKLRILQAPLQPLRHKPRMDRFLGVGGFGR